MEVRESLLIDFEAEVNRLIALKNNDELDDMALDDSYNDMLDRIDEKYRHKDGGHDFSLDIIDIRNIVNLIEETHTDLIEAYMRVVQYLRG